MPALQPAWDAKAMSNELRLPKLGPDDAAVTLLKWHVQAGDVVNPGDLLAELESDKTIVEFEAEQAGVIIELKIAEGSEGVKSGDLLALVGAGGDAQAAAPPAAPTTTEAAEPAAQEPVTKPVAEPAPESAPSPVETEQAAVHATSTSAQGATPMAAAIASQTGADLAAVQGSGENGRITARDVGAPETAVVNGRAPASLSPLAARMLEMTGQSAAAFEASGASNRLTAHDIGIAFETNSNRDFGAGGNNNKGGSTSTTTDLAEDLNLITAEYNEIPANPVKRATARRLSQSKREAPHYYMSMEICVDELVAWRKVLNETRDDDARISVNDIMVKMVAAALTREPSINAAWTGDGVRQYKTVDLAIAVASDRGLMTPVLRNVKSLSVQAIHDSVADLATRAAAGKLAPAEMRGGTFTLSNLGMFGVHDFGAIINPPQAAILAVAAARLVAVPVSADPDSGTVNRSMMTCTLSVDHRAADGIDGARFLNALKEIVEDPRRLLL